MHVVFLVNENMILTGSVALARILLAEASTPLNQLVNAPPISIGAQADDKAVVDLFHKYNLVVLPVVDEKGRLLGIITADDVLELVVKPK